MTSLVLDTHSVVWFLARSSRLSAGARQAIREALSSNHPVYVSAVSIVEIVYLVEKGRFPHHVFTELMEVVRRSDSGIRIVPLDLDVAEKLQNIPRSEVPDMPDRIIGATAMKLGFPLVTSDTKLQAAGLTTLW